MMKTLEIRIQITSEGQLIMPTLPDLQPGEYDAVLVLDTSLSQRCWHMILKKFSPTTHLTSFAMHI